MPILRDLETLLNGRSPSNTYPQESQDHIKRRKIPTCPSPTQTYTALFLYWIEVHIKEQKLRQHIQVMHSSASNLVLELK